MPFIIPFIGDGCGAPIVPFCIEKLGAPNCGMGRLLKGIGCGGWNAGIRPTPPMPGLGAGGIQPGLAIGGGIGAPGLGPPDGIVIGRLNGSGAPISKAISKDGAIRSGILGPPVGISIVTGICCGADNSGAGCRLLKISSK